MPVPFSIFLGHNYAWKASLLGLKCTSKHTFYVNMDYTPACGSADNSSSTVVYTDSTIIVSDTASSSSTIVQSTSSSEDCYLDNEVGICEEAVEPSLNNSSDSLETPLNHAVTITPVQKCET